LHPPREPEYRQKRRHGDFVANLQLPFEGLLDPLIQQWQAVLDQSPPLPQDRVEQLVRERYGNPAWNHQR
jgi:hypothetical protein